MLNTDKVAGFRRVTDTLYEISSEKRLILREAPIEHVFSRAFISEFPLLYRGRELKKLVHLLSNIRNACESRRMKYFDEVANWQFSDWSNGYMMGEQTAAFLLDILTGFGFEVHDAPTPRPPTCESPGKALALLLKS